MKTEKRTKEERLCFFRELYDSARLANGDLLLSMERNMKQYLGSRELDGTTEEATTVRNITYEIVESQVSSDIPRPKADPAFYTEGRVRCAEAIERLCCSMRERLPFEELNDRDERYTYIYGGSVWYVDWDSTLEHSGEVGGIVIRCLSPRDFVGQPGISSVEDMEYCFLRFVTTRGELARRYGVPEEELYLAECEYEYATPMPDGDAVTTTVCFYRDEEGEIGRYVFSGELVLSDLERYYGRKRTVCTACGREGGECECHAPTEAIDEYCEELTHDVTVGGHRLPAAIPRITEDGVSYERVRLPYYVPKLIPIVIRKNTTTEEGLLGGSDCEYIRPEQQAINKIESRILQKLLRAGITPIVPEDARVTLNNQVFGQVIRMKPGESAAQYGKVDTTPDITQDILEAERLYDHAKRIIGISDAYQGISGSASESGLAKQITISQATGRLESKRRMKHTAYAAIDRIIFALHLAFADEPRCLTYRDGLGKVHTEHFCRYDFLEYDAHTGEYRYDDDYVFSIDLGGGVEYQREALWQRNLENLRSGSLGDPASPATLLRYWQCQERSHYPYARENVEYFTELVGAEGVTSYEA